MTSVQPASSTGTDVVNWEGDTGLEDFDASDVSMPRILIDHDKAVFTDSQTDEEFPELVVIILGLHKGRLMWSPIGDSDEGDAPLCKSPNFKDGFPNMDPEVAAKKQFPWGAQSVYKPTDAKPLEITVNDSKILTAPSIGCDKCHFKNWNTDPSGKKPWCSEEWTLPILYQDSEGMWSPALFAVRRTGIKPTKNYLTPFSTRKQPSFVAVTRLSLSANTRGRNQFCTPVYTKLGRTEEPSWPDFRENFLSAKSFLSQFPMSREDKEDEPEDPSLASDVIESNDFTVHEPETKKPEPEPEPPAEPEEPVFSVQGKIKQPTPPSTAPSAGDVVIGDDEEPPF